MDRAASEGHTLTDVLVGFLYGYAAGTAVPAAFTVRPHGSAGPPVSSAARKPAHASG